MAALPRLSCPVIIRVYKPSGVDSGIVYSRFQVPSICLARFRGSPLNSAWIMAVSGSDSTFIMILSPDLAGLVLRVASINGGVLSI